MFNITWKDVRGALISGIIMGVIAVAGYIVSVGDLWKIDKHTLVNTFSISGLTAIVSIVKSFLTDSKGRFLGAIAIK